VGFSVKNAVKKGDYKIRDRHWGDLGFHELETEKSAEAY
jgi:hypothetical protein